jgi:hypothetical protein
VPEPSLVSDGRFDDDEIDRAVERFDRFSADLVLLRGGSLDDLRSEVASFSATVRRHLRSARSPAPRSAAVRSRRIDEEHRRFGESLVQLGWFFGIVESDDHGGHRQALGQYGRLFAEAMRRHRAEERTAAGEVGAELPRRASGKR